MKLLKTNGRLRRFVMIQLVKIQRVYMIASLLLLVLTNSLLFIPYLENRNVHPYVAIVFIFSFLLILLLVVAHVYVRKFGMNQFQHRAEIELNPYNVNHLSPLDELRWGTYYLTSMKVYYEILRLIDKNNSYLPVLKEEIVKVERWVELGYVPPDDAPEHLKKLFESIMEKRL